MQDKVCHKINKVYFILHQLYLCHISKIVDRGERLQFLQLYFLPEFYLTMLKLVMLLPVQETHIAVACFPEVLHLHHYNQQGIRKYYQISTLENNEWPFVFIS